MRPNRLKLKKIINRKNPKKKHLHKKKYFWGSTGIQTADLDNINLVLYKNKKKVAKENLGCSWNVVPKDSCEIYKKRYQRQKEANGRDYENRNNNTDDSEESKDVKKFRQKSSRNNKKRCNCRQRHRRSISKCSHHSTSETSSLNSSESEATN